MKNLRLFIGASVMVLALVALAYSPQSRVAPTVQACVDCEAFQPACSGSANAAFTDCVNHGGTGGQCWYTWVDVHDDCMGAHSCPPYGN